MLSQCQDGSRDSRCVTPPTFRNSCFTLVDDQGPCSVCVVRKSLCAFHFRTLGSQFRTSADQPRGTCRLVTLETCHIRIGACLNLENQKLGCRFSEKFSLSTHQSCASIVSRASEKCRSYPQPPHLSVDSYCAAPKRSGQRPCCARRRSRSALSLMKPAASF